MNFIKRMTALALAGVMFLSLLTACQQRGGNSSASAPDQVPEVVDVNGIDDICAYLSGLPADETVATVDATKITAGELMYWIAANSDNMANYYYYYYGITELPWESTDESGETTLADFILEDAVNYAALQRLLEKKGKAAGLTVSQENKDAIQTAMEAMEADFAKDGVTLEQYLWQQGLTGELFRWNCECDYLYEALVQATFGEGSGNEPTREEILSYREERGEYKVKHILLATIDTTTREALDEQTVAEKKAAADTLLAALRESDEPLALFDEYMNTLSEDPGLINNPEGYIFTANTTVDPAFEEVALALEPGQISDVVEGASGYHIILRLPLEVDVEQDKDVYINAKMAELTDGWITQAEIKTTKAFETLNARVIYEKLTAYRNAITEMTTPVEEEAAE